MSIILDSLVSDDVLLEDSPGILEVTRDLWWLPRHWRCGHGRLLIRCKQCNSNAVLYDRCLHSRCKKQAKCTFKGVNTKLYCCEHKLPGMIDISSSCCMHPNCDVKKPSFNIPGSKKGLYCKEHLLPGMISVNSYKCNHPDCDVKKPSFNTPGLKKGLYCKEHLLPGMINVNSQKCNHPDCDVKKPSFNTPGSKKGLYCKEHLLPGMINVKSPKCNHPNCDVTPSFNTPGSKKGLYCKEHLLPGMIYINSPKCNHPNCDVTPSFNTPNSNKGLYCKEHLLPGMINITSERCKMVMCDIIVSNKKYDGYCFRCFVYTFPASPLVRNYKTKERNVTEYIIYTFSDYTWITDKTVQDGCSRRRPDLLLDLGKYVIIIEVDEDAHINYDCTCENKRIMEISQDLGHRNTVFIRFNPDKYIDRDGVIVKSPWTRGRCGVMSVAHNNKSKWCNRLSVLRETVEYWVANRPEKMIEVVELYYNQN